MQKINLSKLIEDRGLDRAQLAKVLFPTNLHPAQALTRAMSRGVSLREEQVYRLSMFTGLSMEALYEGSLQWVGQAKDRLIRFTRDEFVAVYSAETGLTKVYHLNSLFATHTLSKLNQPLDEYLQEINNIITEKSVRV